MVLGFSIQISKSESDLGGISFLVPLSFYKDDNDELVIDLRETNKFEYNIHQELFSLAVHSEGGFPWDVAYKLPVKWRKFYIKLLMEMQEKEKQEIEKAKGKGGGKPPSGGGMKSPPKMKGGNPSKGRQSYKNPA